MSAQRIVFLRQHPFAVRCRGESVGEGRADVLVDGRRVMELAAVDAPLPVHRGQVLGYLKALDLPFGLLINFKEAALRNGMHRIIRTHGT